MVSSFFLDDYIGSKEALLYMSKKSATREQFSPSSSFYPHAIFPHPLSDK